MDPLSLILDDLRLHAYVTDLTHFHAPWSLRFPSAQDRAELNSKLPRPISPRGDAKPPGGGFHLVVEGRCLLEVDGEGVLEIEEGDLAVVVNRPGMTLRDSAKTPVRLVFDVLPPPPPPTTPRREVRVGGTGAVTSLLGGGFFFDSPQADRLLPALPALILVRAKDMGSQPWTRELTPLLLRELSRMDTGAPAVVNSLANVMFVKAISHYVQTMRHGRGAGWITALLDPEIGKSILAIHRDPGARWSVSKLADHVLMSRSAFAARFTQLVGEPPVAYLTDYRMGRARALLEGGGVAVKEVARRVGYESEAAFSHAYKRHFGESPRVTRGSLRTGA